MLEFRRITSSALFGPFTTINGGLIEIISPTAHCRIKDKGEDKPGPLGRLEYQALLSIEQWAAASNEGVIIWVSPPSPGVYPTSKIIISEIEHEGGVKKLFNRAIILDFDEKECMKFAWNLTSFSCNRPIFTRLGQIRATPLILDTKTKSWIDILAGLVDNPALWQSLRVGEDKVAKEKALAQARSVSQSLTSKSLPPEDAMMQIMGMLGAGSGSCPVLVRGTAFQVFSGSSLTIIGSAFSESYSMGSLYFPCPVCGAINKRPREGYVENCRSCGTDEVVCKPSGTKEEKKEDEDYQLAKVA